MASIFGKKKNRKAQTVAAGAALVVVGAATSFISLPVAVAVAGAWWATGKLTEK